MSDTTNNTQTTPAFDLTVLGPILSVLLDMLLERLNTLESSHADLKSQVDTLKVG
jgi:hypothetical protein